MTSWLQHFCQSDWSLWLASAVTMGGTRYQNGKSAQRVNSGEEHFPTSPVRDQTCDLPIMGLTDYSDTQMC